jgi:hypothetical protein
VLSCHRQLGRDETTKARPHHIPPFASYDERSFEYGEKERRQITDGTLFLSRTRSFSQTVGDDEHVPVEIVCVSNATGSWFCRAKNVPVLRLNYASVQDVLLGMRKGACPGWYEMKIGNKIDNGD